MVYSLVIKIVFFVRAPVLGLCFFVSVMLLFSVFRLRTLRVE